MSWGDFQKQHSPDQRLGIYLGIAQAMLIDLNAVPSDAIRLYSLGVYNDTAVKETEWWKEDETVRDTMSPTLFLPELEKRYRHDPWLRWTLFGEDNRNAPNAPSTIRPDSTLPPYVESKNVLELVHSADRIEDEGLQVRFTQALALAAVLTGGNAAATVSLGSSVIATSAVMTTASILRMRPSQVVGYLRTGGRAAVTGARVGARTTLASDVVAVPASIQRVVDDWDRTQEAMADAVMMSNDAMLPTDVAAELRTMGPAGALRAHLGTVGLPQPPTSAMPSGMATSRIPTTSTGGRGSRSARSETMRAWREGKSMQETAQAAASGDPQGSYWDADEAPSIQQFVNPVEPPGANDPYLGGLPADATRLTTRSGPLGRSTEDERKAFGYGAWQPREETISPRYRQSSYYRIWGAMTPAEVDRFQQLMIRARVINPEPAGRGQDQFLPGRKDAFTQNALLYVLELTNNSTENIDFWAMAEQMATQGDIATAEEEAAEAADDSWRPRIEPFVRRAYEALDPELAANRAIESIEQALGRTPNAWEIELLADTMKAAHRGSYDVGEAARYAEYEAQTDLIMSAQSEEELEQARSTRSPGTFQQVDPEAQFASVFREAFGPEMEERRNKRTMADATANMFSGFDSAETAIGR